MKLIDQLGNYHFFEKIPTRIISLVPSHTETLSDLGLDDFIVGITKFCVRPLYLKGSKTIVGGTKNINFNKIKTLKPDIIFCNKEENTMEIVEQLKQICTVWTTDVISISDNEKMIIDFGQIFNRTTLAKLFVYKINDHIKQISNKHTTKKKVSYCIWKNPWMVVGGETYINTLLKINNLSNTFENQKRYPETDLATIAAMNLDYFLLSSEPFPFKEKDIKEIQSLLPLTKCIIVDGEMFSWHGTRLLSALEYFIDLKF